MRAKSIRHAGTKYTLPFSGLLPELPDKERSDLEADIAERGIVVPVVINDRNEIIDGANRLIIAEVLGLTDVPFKVVTGLTKAQQRQLALDLNLHRRHLTRGQRRERIGQRLKADPGQSDRAIGDAEDINVDHKTVGRVRRHLEERGELPHAAVRIDKMGRPQSATKATKKSKAPKYPIGPAAEPVALAVIGDRLAQWGAWCISSDSVATTAETLDAIQDLMTELRALADQLKAHLAESSATQAPADEAVEFEEESSELPYETNDDEFGDDFQ